MLKLRAARSPRSARFLPRPLDREVYLLVKIPCRRTYIVTRLGRVTPHPDARLAPAGSAGWMEDWDREPSDRSLESAAFPPPAAMGGQQVKSGDLAKGTG